MTLPHVDREFQHADTRRREALAAAARNHLIQEFTAPDHVPYPNERALSEVRTIGQLTFSLMVTMAILSAVFGSIAVIAGIWA